MHSFRKDPPLQLDQFNNFWLLNIYRQQIQISHLISMFFSQPKPLYNSNLSATQGKSKQEFKDNKLTGFYQGFDSKTGLREEGKFQYGQETGLWKEIDEDNDQIHYQFSQERVGAICGDGTRSTATGRGACSWHGGVAEWIYEGVKRRVGGTGKYVPIETRIQSLKEKVKAKLKTNKIGQQFQEEMLKTVLSLLEGKEKIEKDLEKSRSDLKEKEVEVGEMSKIMEMMQEDRGELQAKLKAMELLQSQRSYQLSKQGTNQKEKQMKRADVVVDKQKLPISNVAEKKKSKGGAAQKVKEEELEDIHEKEKPEKNMKKLAKYQFLEEERDEGEEEEEEGIQETQQEKLLRRKVFLQKQIKKFMHYQIDLNEELQNIVNQLLFNHVGKKTQKKTHKKIKNATNSSALLSRDVSSINEKTIEISKKNEKVLQASDLKEKQEQGDENDWESSHFDSSDDEDENYEPSEEKQEKSKDEDLIKQLLAKMKLS